MYSSKGVVVVGRRTLRAKKTGFSQVIFHQGDVPSKPDMALDVASLTLDDSQASLASMPEELWRKVIFLCRRDEPPPDAAADEPEGGLEAYARHFM